MVYLLPFPDMCSATQEVINRLPVFAKYSTDVKEALADRLKYEQVGAGRVVIKQGHDGTNVYFVVSGSLGCRMSEKDPRTGIDETVVSFPYELLKECPLFVVGRNSPDAHSPKSV